MRKPWENLINRAMMTLENGNWLKAVQYLRRSCELYPDQIEAHFDLADIYLHLGHLDAAFETIRKALAVEPLSFPCNFLLGNIYLAQGKIREALKIYLYLEKMTEKPPPELLFQIASAYYAKGCMEKALCYSMHAIEEDPSSIESYELAARIYFDKGNLIKAKDTYQEILSIDFENVNAHHMLGIIYSREKRWLDAIQEWEIALTIAPNEDETMRELACALSLLGDEENAVRLLHRALEINPENMQAKLDLCRVLQDRT